MGEAEKYVEQKRFPSEDLALEQNWVLSEFSNLDFDILVFKFWTKINIIISKKVQIIKKNRLKC